MLSEAKKDQSPSIKGQLGSLFADTSTYYGNYPYIFRELFTELSEDIDENEDKLKLLLIVTCKASLREKMHFFKAVLCLHEVSSETSD